MASGVRLGKPALIVLQVAFPRMAHNNISSSCTDHDFLRGGAFTGHEGACDASSAGGGRAGGDGRGSSGENSSGETDGGGD